MALSREERGQLAAYIRARTCAEYRQDKPCVERKQNAKMVGVMHEGCYHAEQMLALVAKA